MSGAGRFDPAIADVRWQRRWDDAHCFVADTDSPSPRPTCWRCFPIHRDVFTSATPATMPWATCLPATSGAGLRSASPDGLGRLRNAGRERGDGARRSSRRMDRGQYPGDARSAQAARPRDRLVPRDRHLRPGLLWARAGPVPRPVRSGARLSQGERGQLGSRRHDRARQRAGHRRQTAGGPAPPSSGASCRNGFCGSPTSPTSFSTDCRPSTGGPTRSG